MQRSVILDHAWHYLLAVTTILLSIDSARNTTLHKAVRLRAAFYKMLQSLACDADLRSLYTALVALRPPANDSDVRQGVHFAADLSQTLQRELDIGHQWNLPREDWQALNDYLAANLRLVECLNLAAVSDRVGIKSRLLLPPA